MNIIPYVLSVGILSLVAACGSDDDGSDSLPDLEEAQNVTYRAVLEPVNGSGTMGTATIRRDADQFEVQISMAGAPSTVHAQHIHTGSACPSAANAGADQIIDAVEAETVTGKALIKLDSDLSSGETGGVYPAGRSYRYNESTSWPALITDLGQPLRLTGRVIEIHGTTLSLPDTVSGNDGETAARSFPIACGVLVEIPSEG